MWVSACPPQGRKVRTEEWAGQENPNNTFIFIAPSRMDVSVGVCVLGKYRVNESKCLRSVDAVNLSVSEAK